MPESGAKKIITHDGTSLTIPIKKKPNLIDLLPSPKDVAREIAGGGLSDGAVNANWLYSENGKAPR